MRSYSPAKSQAGEVNYDLHSLGWKSFQNLCATIIADIWGQNIQTFFDSKDGGRDGAFHGQWTNEKGEEFKGSFTVQCKFTSKKDSVLKVSDLRDDISKAKRLAARGLATNYFLFSNSKLTGKIDEDLRKDFEAIPGIKRFSAYGRDRISQIIRESPRLRMLVPRVYGLGDLSEILDERAYAQAQEILSSLGDDLAKFVITEAYKKSAKALVTHGFVLLLGEPACGKSTIAAALTLGALDEWGCSTIKLTGAEDFMTHWNPHYPKQLFWVDDVFGMTQFDKASATAWTRLFPHIQASLRRGTKVLFTSRDYIYRAAKAHLKESALPVIKESQVVIHVEQLSKDEREQILYNHIKLGDQSIDYKRLIKRYLPDIATHMRFSPEIARRLGNTLFTKDIIPTSEGFNDFVENPVKLLCEIVRTLDSNSRAALVLVFMRGGTLTSPIQITEDEEKSIRLMDSAIGGVREALDTLNGSLLLKSFQDGNHVIRFKHPTIRDAIATIVAEDLEFMDIYLNGTPIEKMFDEISCGDVGIEGVKVIIPPTRYDALIVRLKSYDISHWRNKSSFYSFLAHRCDRDFLNRCLSQHLVPSLNVYSYLYAVADVDLILRLHEFGLLPEKEKLSTVARIRVLAVDTPDSGFLREDIRKLLSQNDFDDILEDVRTDLLPNLNDTIDNWRDIHDGKDDIDDYFSELMSVLEDYRKVFVNDDEAVAYINNAFKYLEEIMNEMRADQTGEIEDAEYYETSLTRSGQTETRSIFDDVDL
jgi:hypothetical protein